MEPLIPPHPAPPPPASVAPPPPVAMAPPPPVAMAPPPPVAVAHPPPIDHSQNPHGIGDETKDMLYSPSNPYHMNLWEWVFISGTIFGFSFSIGATYGFWDTIILYGYLLIFGFLAGSATWFPVGKWSVSGKGLDVWRSKWLSLLGINCFSGNGKMIRIDSYAIENRPTNKVSDHIFSIHQAKIASYLCFGLLFTFVPDLTQDSASLELFSRGGWLIMLSPIIASLLVPLYIFSDSSVVEIIPSERDFAPVGLTFLVLLKRAVKWALLSLIVYKFAPLIATSGLGAAFELAIDMLVIMSMSATTVLAASVAYSNKKHFELVEIFNTTFFDINVHQDHTFREIDNNAFIVMPKHLMKDTIEYLTETRGANFARVPQNPVNPSLVAQNLPHQPGVDPPPPPPPPASSVYNVGS